MNKQKIILDCDPGHDDAIAILLAVASPRIDLLGITVVAGNQTIEKTAQNALNVARFLNSDVPIAIGCPLPIVRDRIICSAVHGESGLDGFTFPKYEKNFDKRHACQMMIDLIMTNEDVGVVTTGPMTNLAMAMRLEPRIIKRIKKVILMGGSIDNGNTSPAAEFNIMCDAEAAHIVFNSGVDVYMCGLNITRKILVRDEIVNRMAKINNRVSDMFVQLMKVFNENQRKTFGLEAGPLHDPVTIVSLIDESVVTFKKMNVVIDINHGSSYGRTNCDVFDYLHAPKNAYVAMDVDVDK
jgi:ribosylpyrimidine nucleosidase